MYAFAITKILVPGVQLVGSSIVAITVAVFGHGTFNCQKKQQQRGNSKDSAQDTAGGTTTAGKPHAGKSDATPSNQ